jgi:hypothetical protein
VKLVNVMTGRDDGSRIGGDIKKYLQSFPLNVSMLKWQFSLWGWG